MDYIERAPEGHTINAWTPCPPDEGGIRALNLVEELRKTNNVPMFVRTVRDAVKSETGSRNAEVDRFLFLLGTILAR